MITLILVATTGGILAFTLQPLGSRTSNLAYGQSLVPVPGAQVTATGVNGTGIASANAQGQYNITSYLGAGSYQVTASASGYVDTTVNDINVSSGVETPNVNIVLQASGVITGKVTDALTGMPLQNAQVTAVNSTGAAIAPSATTDANGNYQINQSLPTGTYSVTVVYVSGVNGYLNTTESGISVTAGATTSNVDVALPRSGVITGTITDANTQQPLQGITVVCQSTDGLYTDTAITNSTGQFVLQNNLPTDTYNLTEISPTGYLVNTLSSVSVTSGATTTENVALNPSAVISGIVTNYATGQPIEGAYVYTLNVGGQTLAYAYTDASGNYTLNTNLPTGNYIDSVYAVYEGQYGSVGIPGGLPLTAGQTAYNIDIEISIPPSGTITGTVTDPGSPIPDAQVSVRGPNGYGYAITAQNGSYTISTNLPNGTYSVTFTATGYVSQTINGVQVTDNQVTVVNVVLKFIPSGIISGLVQALQTSSTPTTTPKTPSSGILLPLIGILAAVFGVGIIYYLLRRRLKRPPPPVVLAGTPPENPPPPPLVAPPKEEGGACVQNYYWLHESLDLHVFVNKNPSKFLKIADQPVPMRATGVDTHLLVHECRCPVVDGDLSRESVRMRANSLVSWKIIGESDENAYPHSVVGGRSLRHGDQPLEEKFEEDIVNHEGGFVEWSGGGNLPPYRAPTPKEMEDAANARAGRSFGSLSKEEALNQIREEVAKEKKAREEKFYKSFFNAKGARLTSTGEQVLFQPPPLEDNQVVTTRILVKISHDDTTKPPLSHSEIAYIITFKISKRGAEYLYEYTVSPDGPASITNEPPPNVVGLCKPRHTWKQLEEIKAEITKIHGHTAQASEAICDTDAYLRIHCDGSDRDTLRIECFPTGKGGCTKPAEEDIPGLSDPIYYVWSSRVLSGASTVKGEFTIKGDFPLLEGVDWRLEMMAQDVVWHAPDTPGIAVISVNVRDTGREFKDKRETLSLYIRVKEPSDTSTQTPPSPPYSSAPLPKTR
jgi:hypothetical protein